MKWRRQHPGYGCRTNLVPRTVRAWLGSEWGTRVIVDHKTEHVHGTEFGWCYCGRQVRR